MVDRIEMASAKFRRYQARIIEEAKDCGDEKTFKYALTNTTIAEALLSEIKYDFFKKFPTLQERIPVTLSDFEQAKGSLIFENPKYSDQIVEVSDIILRIAGLI